MLAHVCSVVLLTITAYVPGAGGINGGDYGGYDRVGGRWVGGKRLTNSDAACGFNYSFGTLFFIIPKEGDPQPGVNMIRECNDRGGMIGPQSLDLAIVRDDKAEAMRIAKKWGKQRRAVVVCGAGVK